MRRIVVSMFLATAHFVAVASSSVDTNALSRERVESSDDIVWYQQVGPGNAGFANMLRYHPTIPGKVMNCPDMWNSYMSDDNGEQWYGITDPDGDASFYHIRDLQFSHTDSDFAIAIASSLLFRSTNCGRSWEKVTNCPWYKLNEEGLDTDSWRRKVASLAIDPTDSDVWYVGGGANVSKQNWLSSLERITEANPRGSEDPKRIFCIGELWRTTNGGKSWKSIKEGLDPKVQVGRIVVNPKDPKQLFVSSNFGIYKSENQGDSWVQISSGKLESDIVMDMDYYYNAASGKFILYAIDQTQYIPDGKSTRTRGGIFMSTDEGETWQNITGNLHLDINRLTGGVPKNYYQYLSKWFEVTAAEAKKLYPELPTKALQIFNMIAVDPSREGALYLGHADPQTGLSIMPGRLWSTTNNGESWINTARLYEENWMLDRDYWEERGNPVNGNMTVGHQSRHMRQGNDYALRSMRGLAVGVDGSVMIISDHSTMLSSDHGATWHQRDEYYTPSGAIVGRGNSNLPGLTIAQDKRGNRTILGTGEHRVMIPTYDDPEGKIALKYIKTAPETAGNIIFDPYDPEVCYLTSNRQTGKQFSYISRDSGLSWDKLGVATPATNRWLDDFYTNGLLIDPINNQYLYHGITIINDMEKANMGGFYRSEDGGKTFQQSNSGLPEVVRVNDVQFDPRDRSNKSLFIAAERYTIDYHGPKAPEGGLYHSTDRGVSWKRVKTPVAVEGVQFVKFDHTNRMYITTGYRQGGAGVWYSDDFGKSWKQIFKYPGTESIDISPFDNNMIVVSVRFMSKNPGLYLSRDRGETWSKCNTNITIPHQIEDVKFDIFKPDEIWCATLGCGFYKGKIKEIAPIQVVKVSPQSYTLSVGDSVKISANEKRITWRSENEAIATVSKSGEVKGVGSGLVKIWASTPDGRYTDYTLVTVQRE
ncbi:MAG: Ig-like domain-containing protein [Rikenellaceae bacterium]